MDHVPVVEVEELTRIPLHILAGVVTLASDRVRIDRCLVPVKVHDRIRQARCAGKCCRLGGSTGCEASLTFDQMDPGRVIAVGIRCSNRQAE